MRICTMVVALMVVAASLTAQWSRPNNPATATIIGIHKIPGTNILLAGHANLGILRSTNGGGTWAPSNSGTLFAGTSPSTFVQSGSRIFALAENVYSKFHTTTGYSYYSDDNGLTWNNLDGSYGSTEGFGRINDTLYTGSANSDYLAFSADNGTTWKNIPTNLGTLTNYVIYGLTCAKGNVIVSCMNSGIFYSTDRGATFTKSIDASGTTITDFYVFDTIAYAVEKTGNVYRSLDGGVRWSIYSGLPNVIGQVGGRLAIMGNLMFAGTLGGLSSSTVGDSYFAPITMSNIPNTMVHAVCVDGSALYIGTAAGFHKSLDSGKTWTTMNAGLSYGAFNVMKAYGSTYYLGSGSGEVFRSTNSGGSWSLLNSATPLNSISDLAVTTGRVHVNANGMKTTTDNGATWVVPSTANLPTYGVLNTFDELGDTLWGYWYDAIFGQSGMFRSQNGIDWVKPTTNLPSKRITKILRSNNSLLAMLQDSGIYRRTSKTSAWSLSLSKATRLYSSGATLFAATPDTSIYSSANDGATWTKIGRTPINSFTICDRIWKAGDSLYASSSSYDFLVSGDNGATWVDHGVETYIIRPGFSDQVTILGSFNGSLYVSPSNNGLYVRGAVPTSVSSHNEQIPTSMQLLQNYPNPFNPSTNVDFQLPIAGEVRLSIFDLLGREVATLVNEEKPAGRYTVTWDAAHLPSGVYLYRLTTGSIKETKKMVLLR